MNIYKMRSRGFTLIELLVVIAIIAVLASVVLASLNTARSKGADAAVKSNLGSSRAQAELFYDDNGLSYDGVCALGVTGSSTIGAMVEAAAEATGGTYAVSDTADATAAVAACHDAAAGWAAMAPLETDNTQGWCVDSTGAAEELAITALDTNSDITCN